MTWLIYTMMNLSFWTDSWPWSVQSFWVFENFHCRNSHIFLDAMTCLFEVRNLLKLFGGLNFLFDFCFFLTKRVEFV